MSSVSDHHGMLVGYARVSTAEQSLDRQITELEAAGCARLFTDEGKSGRNMHRPGLARALDFVREGDSLVVQELSRLGRHTQGVLQLIGELEQRRVGFRVLNLGLDTATPTGQLIITVLAAVAQLEVDLTRERVMSGLAEARRQGRVGGRPPVLTELQRAHVIEQQQLGRSFADLALLMGVSERTIRRVVAGRPSLQGHE